MPGGSNEAMVELNAAYAFVLNELKEGYQRQEKEEAQQRASSDESPWHDVNENASHGAERDTYWRNLYRDIDEELERLRSAAEHYDEQLRRMREAAWQTGQHAAWAKLTWDDLSRFFRDIARSGVKGLTLLFAALVGVGSVLAEANVVSALILLGSGLGFACSLALKSDKGGFLSAALLLFGIMTLWLPPVRAALFLQPLATITVLILLALIFKFAPAGGTVGLLTGFVLAIFVLSAILSSTANNPPIAVNVPPSAPPPISRPPIATPQVTPAPPVPTPPVPSQTVAPAPPEPRTLLAADGAILKFVSGVPYRLKVRNGRATFLRASQGAIQIIAEGDDSGACVGSVGFPREPGNGPWRQIDRLLRACEGDAIVTVQTSP
jgi:hypothetical protein